MNKLRTYLKRSFVTLFVCLTSSFANPLPWSGASDESLSVPGFPFAGRVNDLAISKEKTWAVLVGDQGTLAVSLDQGETWNLGKFERKRIFSELNHVSIVNNSIALAVGDSGFVAISRDKAITWKRLKLKTNCSLTAIASYGSGFFIIGSSCGDCFYSKNEGLSWNKMNVDFGFDNKKGPKLFIDEIQLKSQTDINVVGHYSQTFGIEGGGLPFTVTYNTLSETKDFGKNWTMTKSTVPHEKIKRQNKFFLDKTIEFKNGTKVRLVKNYGTWKLLKQYPNDGPYQWRRF